MKEQHEYNMKYQHKLKKNSQPIVNTHKWVPVTGLPQHVKTQVRQAYADFHDAGSE